MNESTKKRYLTGREVLEHFVPGYHAGNEDQDAKPKELKEKLLAGLKDKLENLKITRPKVEPQDVPALSPQIEPLAGKKAQAKARKAGD